MARACWWQFAAIAVTLLALGCVANGASQSGNANPYARFKKGTDLTKQVVEEIDEWQVTGSFSTVTWLIGLVFPHAALISMLLLIGGGVACREYDAVPERNIDFVRQLCFKALLPSFLFRRIWLVPIDSSLYGIAAWSLVLHIMWFCLTYVVSGKTMPHDPQLRGWSMLMSQGALLSFLYPVLLHNSHFGDRALACAVLWDLGGNMWIVQGALFAVAAYFEPKSRGKRRGGGYDDFDGLEADEMDGLGDDYDDYSNGLSSLNNSNQSGLNPSQVAAIKAALTHPILLGCLTGLFFNLLSMPCPYVVDKLLELVGEPYKVALYFLVGFYGDHKLDREGAGLVATALGTRYAISIAMIMTVWFFVPVDALVRETIVLAILSPCSTLTIYLVAEHNYGEKLMKNTVCCVFFSVLFSTFCQHALVAQFSSAAAAGAAAAVGTPSAIINS